MGASQPLRHGQGQGAARKRRLSQSGVVLLLIGLWGERKRPNSAHTTLDF